MIILNTTRLYYVEVFNDALEDLVMSMNFDFNPAYTTEQAALEILQSLHSVKSPILYFDYNHGRYMDVHDKMHLFKQKFFN